MPITIPRLMASILGKPTAVLSLCSALACGPFGFFILGHAWEYDDVFYESDRTV